MRAPWVQNPLAPPSDAIAEKDNKPWISPTNPPHVADMIQQLNNHHWGTTLSLQWSRHVRRALIHWQRLLEYMPMLDGQLLLLKLPKWWATTSAWWELSWVERADGRVQT
jgi:hypothetical protein